MKPRIERAVVGWSNWRSGTEFYEDTEAKGEGYGRWLPRAGHPDHPQGRLLTDALSDPEGATAVVVLLPPDTDPTDLMDYIEDVVDQLVDPEDERKTSNAS